MDVPARQKSRTGIFSAAKNLAARVSGRFRLTRLFGPQKTYAMPYPGYRGISVEFDSDKVSYISADDRVDVIFTVTDSTTAEKWGKCAATILSNVSVIAVQPSESNKGKSVVRFALNPDEAQYLELVRYLGNVHLSLRKKGDQTLPAHPISSWETILKGIPAKAYYYLEDHGEAAIEEARPAADLSNAGKTEILAAVQTRMRGGGYNALSFSLATAKTMFVRAGDRVDVLATVNIKKPGQFKAKMLTVTLLQNLRVLANRASAFHPGQNLLLLEMNWTDAQDLALALDTAEVQLISRNKTDMDIHPMSPASLDRLFR